MTQDEQTTAVAAQQPRAPAQKAVAKWYEAMPPDLMAEAGMIVASGYYPSLKAVAQAGFKMWVAQQLGFSKIEGLQYVYVIEPKQGSTRPPAIVLGYQLKLARVQRSGEYDYRVESKTADECRIAFFRRGEKIGTSVFTMQDARRQGLVKEGGNWEKMPETMLFARAATNGISTYCPSVLGGTEAEYDDAFIIEGTARVIDDGVEPPEETHGEDLAPDPWARFWARMRDLWPDKNGVDLRKHVHGLVPVPNVEGALATAVRQKAIKMQKTVPQVVAELLVSIEAIAAREAKDAKPQMTPGEDPGIEESFVVPAKSIEIINGEPVELSADDLRTVYGLGEDEAVS